MIQRIQSLFLVLSAAAMISMLFVKVWDKTGISEEFIGHAATMDAYQLVYTVDGVVNEERSMSTVAIAVFSILSVVASVFALFSFKNRMRQMKVSLFSTFMVFVVAMLNLYYAYYTGESIFDVKYQGNFHTGFYLPLAGIFFLRLANRFIKKDDDLVKSVDRLR